MKNHAGVVIGVLMLVVAGLVMSQVGLDGTLRGDVSDTTINPSTQEEGEEFTTQSPPPPPPDGGSPDIECEDKLFHGDDLAGAIVCGRSEKQARENYLKQANAFCASQKFSGTPKSCSPPTYCKQNGGLVAVAGENTEADLICRKGAGTCGGAQWGCGVQGSPHCDLIRKCTSTLSPSSSSTPN